MEQRHQWQLTAEEYDHVAFAALAHPRATKRVRSIKIKLAPGPKVSWETTKAFDKIRSAISDMTFASFQLNEGELLGLQQLIEQHVEEKSSDHRSIWRGILADHTDLLKLMEARRTGSGEWVASVELMKWNESESEGECVKYWHEKHPTRDAAIEAAKRLAQEHVSEMRPNMSFEARVVSAFDWVD
jgi:hypothetical protein